jgi:hypothetical protein
MSQNAALAISAFTAEGGEVDLAEVETMLLGVADATRNPHKRTALCQNVYNAN